MGLIDNVKNALTPQQKALAANALIMEQTSDAAGDFGRTSDGLANKQRILKAQLENVKVQIGQKLLPAFSALVDGFMKALPHIVAFGRTILDVGKWLGEHKEVLIGVAVGVTAALVPAFIAWAASAGAAAAATLAAAAPMIALGAAIAALVAGIIYAYQHFDWFRNAVDAVFAAVRKIVEVAFEAIVAVIDWFVDTGKRLWDTFGGDIMKIASSYWDAIRGMIDGALKTIKGIIQAVTAAIHGDWSKAWDGIKMALSGVWESMRSYVQGMVGIFSGILSALWKPVSSGLDSVWSSIQSVWGTILGFVRGLPGQIAAATSGMWDGIKSAFRSAINWIIAKWNGLEFTIPGFEAFGVKVGGVTIGVPDIPMLANGGIVTQPTLAVIGEAGPEAVVPLRNGGLNGGGNTYHVSVNVGVGDKNAIANEVVGLIDVFERQNGRRFARAA